MSECILELDDTSINQLDVLLKKDEKGKENYQRTRWLKPSKQVLPEC